MGKASVIIITDVTASHVSTYGGSLKSLAGLVIAVGAGARAEQHTIALAAPNGRLSLQVPAPQRGLPRPLGRICQWIS